MLLMGLELLAVNYYNRNLFENYFKAVFTDQFLFLAYDIVNCFILVS